jgi:hypothetical protein
MTTDEKRMVALGLGVLGGLVIGKQAYEHVFVEGLDETERTMLLRGGVTGLAIWAIKTFVDLRPYRDYMQWLDPTGVLTG